MMSIIFINIISSHHHQSSFYPELAHYKTRINLIILKLNCSYYILQIIEEDKGHECYVFRKWGRVGNEKIGGKKLEQMSKIEAIDEFKHLFLEKTGNSWEIWELRKNFVKHPGRFFPLDIVCNSTLSFFFSFFFIFFNS